MKEALKRCIPSAITIVGMTLILLFFPGRKSKAQEYPVPDRTDRTTKSPLNYFWDSRTNLCFASIYFPTAYGYSGYSIANVPCSKEVSAVIGSK